MTPLLRKIVLIGGLTLFCANAMAQEETVTPIKPAPYDSQLIRLSEILGSLQFLRNLCASQQENQWLILMEKLLQEEAADEAVRKARLTAAFNHGYRSYAAIHTKCTAETREIAEKYRVEGATLAAEITARYGN
jgi:uncharacterized protein (TIGR02301 family)